MFTPYTAYYIRRSDSIMTGGYMTDYEVIEIKVLSMNKHLCVCSDGTGAMFQVSEAFLYKSIEAAEEFAFGELCKSKAKLKKELDKVQAAISKHYNEPY